ncbi:hypothetical protein QAD02_011446, partial [Eretmocerus hayati]
NETDEWTNRTISFAEKSSYFTHESWEDQCLRLCNDIKQTCLLDSSNEGVKYTRRALKVPAIYLRESLATGIKNNDRLNHLDKHDMKNIVKDESKYIRAHSNRNCTHLDQNFKNGDAWETNNCETCSCSLGQVKCEPINCLPSSFSPVSSLSIHRSKCCLAYNE